MKSFEAFEPTDFAGPEELEAAYCAAYGLEKGQVFEWSTIAGRAMLRMFRSPGGAEPTQGDPLTPEEREHLERYRALEGKRVEHCQALEQAHKEKQLRVARARGLFGARFTEPDLRRMVRRDFDDHPGLRFVNEWSIRLHRDDSAPRVLLLCGHPGVGKSFSAGAWLVNCPTTDGSLTGPHLRDDMGHLKQSANAYTDERELAALLGNSNFSTSRERYDELLGADMLVVDEIGAERDDARGKRLLLDIVERRKGRQTILITNLAFDALKERRGTGPTLSRLRAHGELKPVVGPDLREASGFWPDDTV